MDEKTLQDDLYRFPYHHIAFGDSTIPTRTRSLWWAFEYVCYISHILSIVQRYSPSSLLDVGCGDGAFLTQLNGIVQRKVGVDTSPDAIGFARAFDQDSEYYALPVQSVQECFDIVTLIEVLEHVPDEDISDFLAAVMRRVRIGGHLIISVPTTARPVIPKHYRHYTPALLRHQLDAAQLRATQVSMNYVYRESRLLKAYIRATVNRYWTVQFRPLEWLAWSWIRHRASCADSSGGTHLILTLERLE